MAMLGGSAMVGELSKYRKYTIQPGANTDITFTHNLGVVPKLVLLDGQPDLSGSITYITHGIFDQYCGGCLVGSAGTQVGYKTDTTAIGTTNTYLYMNDTTVSIRRASSARYFDTNCTYTVELYA